MSNERSDVERLVDEATVLRIEHYYFQADGRFIGSVRVGVDGTSLTPEPLYGGVGYRPENAETERLLVDRVRRMREGDRPFGHAPEDEQVVIDAFLHAGEPSEQHNASGSDAAAVLAGEARVCVDRAVVQSVIRTLEACALRVAPNGSTMHLIRHDIAALQSAPDDDAAAVLARATTFLIAYDDVSGRWRVESEQSYDADTAARIATALTTPDAPPFGPEIFVRGPGETVRHRAAEFTFSYDGYDAEGGWIGHTFCDGPGLLDSLTGAVLDYSDLLICPECERMWQSWCAREKERRDGR